jgi:hypothetical protein
LAPAYSLENINAYTSNKVASIIGSTLSTNHTDTITITFDEQARVSNVTRNGYDFLGYALDGDLSEATIFNADTSVTIVALNNTTIKNGAFIYNNGNKETLGSKPLDSSNYTINLHAFWSPIRYTVKINANTILGSTQAYVYDTLSNTYLVSPLVADLTYYVEFDTNIWSQNISFANNDIAEITLGRIGYTWQGLYPTADCDETNKFLLIDAGRTTRTFDADLFEDLGANVNPKTKLLTLFAGWEARTYNVTINENLSNINNTYNDETSKVSYLTGSDVKSTYDSPISVVFDSDDWTNLLDRTSETKMDRYGFTWNYLYSTQYSSLGTEISSSTTLNLELLTIILYDDKLDNLRELDIINFFHEKDTI